MLMQKVPQDNDEDRVTPEQIARWEALRNRLADELARGFTLRRIAIDTSLEPAQIEEWAKASTAFRKPSRWCGEPPFAEQIESKVAAWFAELDAERNQPGMDKPSFVETGTARDIIAGFQRARALRRAAVRHGQWITTLRDAVRPKDSIVRCGPSRWAKTKSR